MAGKRYHSHSTLAILDAVKASVSTLQWAVFLLGIFYLFSGVTMVAPHETAVRYRLGVLQKKTHGSGLLLSFPSPIDRVVKIPTGSIQELALEDWGAAPDAKQTVEMFHPTKHGYTLTADRNVVQGRFSFRYQIVQPADYLAFSADPEPLLRATVYRALTETLAQRPVNDVFTTGLDLLRESVVRRTQNYLESMQAGVKVVALEVREIVPTREVLPAFEEVINAQMEARTLVERAKAYHAAQIPTAQAEAYRLQQEGAAYAQNLIATAQGEANAFRALWQEYRLQPQLVRARLLAEARETVLTQVNSTSTLPTERTRVFLKPKKNP